jgi:hypothetical protein
MTSEAVSKILDRAEKNEGQLRRMLLELILELRLPEGKVIEIFTKTHQPETKAPKRGGGVRFSSIRGV